MQLEGERAAVGKRENGAVFQMGRAVALKPWTFNARGATVLDEEVAGLQMDVEWTLPEGPLHCRDMHSACCGHRRPSLAQTSTPSRTLWCSRGVACLAQRMRPRLRPTRRKMADAMVHKADPLRRGGTIPNCTPRALTRGGKNFSMLDIGPTSGVFSQMDAP